MSSTHVRGLRLTVRGRVVLALLGAVMAAALTGLAWLSAPASAGSTTNAGTTPAVVTVSAGDTLWSIAGDIAPNRDPRDVVSDLRKINDLATPYLTPGQTLRTS